ncbi:LacI family DNA-binding transcriptional regulator [Culicoidibacter larvae]|uniref:LacI family transcriptional regulator n=1 Tax=Culicoidibacter larvae TaxID=2579976 RepID=A0A5R8QE84_9FIRM|nr:LacI family DNA-binding transcriptional regulator [Culicoidibacter larvae]TLG75498.1 LacI family transcriptional regulator [Culicoidibacter larvae]
MTTLADVARQANVSKMTVSRVINHPEKVTKELHDLVTQAMEELNYRPNYAAKALANNRTQVIKYVVSEDMDTTDPYFMHLLTGISRGLSEHYFSLQVVHEGDWSVGRADGFIFTGLKNEDYLELETLESPLVVFGENDFGYDFIDVDNITGIKHAVEHVYELGFRNILYFGIDRNEQFAHERERGYDEMMQKYQLTPKKFVMENRSTSACKVANELFEDQKLPAAIVCASDRIALGVLRAAHDSQLRVPDVIAVTGFDGVFLDQIAHPKLTTIRQPLVKMGTRLAEIIIQKIENNTPAETINEFFEPELIVRESTRRKK